ARPARRRLQHEAGRAGGALPQAVDAEAVGLSGGRGGSDLLPRLRPGGEIDRQHHQCRRGQFAVLYAIAAGAQFWERVMTDWQISPDAVDAHNKPQGKALAADYAALGEQLARRGVDIDGITKRVAAFHVAVPSWG